MKKQTKTIWVNFLHMYQPPWQDRGMLERVATESYDYLLTLLEKYPKFRVSLNISGSLLEQLAQVRPGLLARLHNLVISGRIELVGTACYHPILPLISLDESRRQIELNEKSLKKYFPSAVTMGFYLPEMSFSLPVAKLIKKLGYEWLILDPIHYNGQVSKDVLYILKNVGLKILFRDKQISKHYPPGIIYDHLHKNKAEIFISATDAEIYGHQHQDTHGYVEKLMFSDALEILTVGQYLQKLSNKKNIVLRPASWESSIHELQQRNPYSLWADPKNKIHKLLWQLLRLASSLVKKYRTDKNIIWARGHLDRGMSSCVFWWASGRKPSPFSPLTWNPDIIDKGAEELIRSIRSLDKADAVTKIGAEKIYLEIKKQTWFRHWNKYNKKSFIYD